MILAEFDFAIYDAEKNRIEILEGAESANVAWPHWLELTAQSIRKRGHRTDVASHLVQWVTEHGAFENLAHEEYWIPTSPFAVGHDSESVRTRRVGGVVRDDIRVRVTSIFSIGNNSSLIAFDSIRRL